MQYFLIFLGALVLFLLILLLLTGGSMQNLVGFFVEELDDNNTPVHPVRLFARDETATLSESIRSDVTTAPEVPAAAPAAPPAAPELPKAEPEPPKAEPEEPTEVFEELPHRNVRKNASRPPAKSAGKVSSKTTPQRGSRQGSRRNPNQVYTEYAFLTHKIDERRRVVDSLGHSTLSDEYFELVFETRRGETLRLVTSRAAFKEIPFNEDGALTYKRNRLIRFKYSGGTVENETLPPSPAQDK